MPLIASAVRFVRAINRYLSPEEVILALHASLHPPLHVLGAWSVPLSVRRGARHQYPIYAHPESEPFFRDYWAAFKQHGPSVLARFAWRTRRDFRMHDVLHAEHPDLDDLWIFELLHKHGIKDLVYIAVFDCWYVVFWSPKSLRLDKNTWCAARIAADAAVRRIEELVGVHVDSNPKLTACERNVLRLLKDDRSEREVAGLLKVGVSTVKQYVARSRRKLRTTGLRDTIAEAVRHYGLLAMVLIVGEFHGLSPPDGRGRASLSSQAPASSSQMLMSVP